MDSRGGEGLRAIGILSGRNRAAPGGLIALR